MKKLLASLLLLLPAVALAATPAPQTSAEIDHLFSYLKSSGCEFNRNGSWYGADEAVNHLHKKYEYLLDKGYVGTTEDFVKRAATESSISGKPYQVRCKGAAPMPSGGWFRAELAKYRTARH